MAVEYIFPDYISPYIGGFLLLGRSFPHLRLCKNMLFIKLLYNIYTCIIYSFIYIHSLCQYEYRYLFYSIICDYYLNDSTTIIWILRFS